MRISDWSSDVCSSDLLVIPSFGQDHAVGDNLDLAAIVGREDAPSLAILHVSVDHGGRDASVPKCISNVHGMSDSRTEYYGLPAGGFFLPVVISEARSGGKEGVNKCRYRWQAIHKKTTNNTKREH